MTPRGECLSGIQIRPFGVYKTHFWKLNIHFINMPHEAFPFVCMQRKGCPIVDPKECITQRSVWPENHHWMSARAQLVFVHSPNNWNNYHIPIISNIRISLVKSHFRMSVPKTPTQRRNKVLTNLDKNASRVDWIDNITYSSTYISPY